MNGLNTCTCAVVLSLALSGCTSLASGTNSLSDDRIRSESAGALGYDPAELTLVSRRTEGTNTYASLKAADGKEFTCIINGGNLLSLGMTNPPACGRKGEAINANPLR
ncbi:hypothetical protein QF205_08395 [Luteimonas composti]|uniref:Uncharacterized protein n=1 Tax=Luteimonas composti TaxID=398257 RepID=A0ABT6MR64_9GAMM|nr:hypothetical protein [Luteimonas composti]MDH7453089.1 hypothetical protein [Luteimonas composti]